MSRWNNFVERLDEKVSKKEINIALKNSNILIGCEFEFKLDDGLEGNGGTESLELYEHAYREAKDYNDSLEQYQIDINEYNNETEEIRAKLVKAEDEILETTDALERQEEHNEELETNITDAQTEKDEAEAELDTHEADKDVWVEEDTLDDWEAVKRELNTRISNAKVDIYRHGQTVVKNGQTEVKWNKDIADNERRKSDYENDIKYREEEGMHEQVEEPYCAEQTMPNYFEYMREYEGYSEQDLYTEPGEECTPPNEPNYDGEVEDLEQAVNDSGILDNAPFDHYEIGEYGSVSQEVGSRDWAIEDDTSLGMEGLEIKNPPMDLPEFIKDYLGDMFDWIGQHGYTDGDCGFHCHMSVKNPKNEIDMLKLILFTDEGWIYNAFSDRVGSTYASSVKNKLMTKGTIDKKTVEKIFTKKKLIMKLSMTGEHFDAIHSIDDKGHVEFRYMGGSNYHKKLKDVTATIGMYAHNLSLAMDPEYKWKEYRAKLERVFNKMELFQHEKNVQVLRVIKTKMLKDGGYLEQQEIKEIDKILKRENISLKRLSSIYKMDGKTRSALKANRQFMIGVASESNKIFKGVGAGFAASAGMEETNSWH